MELFLPDVDWQGQKMTLASQFKKLSEEVGELGEALINRDPVNSAREVLDVAQSAYTMLLTIMDDWEKEYGSSLPLQRFLDEHEAKLERKGYLKEQDPYAEHEEAE